MNFHEIFKKASSEFGYVVHDTVIYVMYLSVSRQSLKESEVRWNKYCFIYMYRYSTNYLFFVCCFDGLACYVMIFQRRFFTITLRYFNILAWAILNVVIISQRTVDCLRNLVYTSCINYLKFLHKSTRMWVN